MLEEPEDYDILIEEDGSKFWYYEGKLHREDGPAVEYSYGTKFWYYYGNIHREDGPAVEWTDGCKAWFLVGINYLEEEYNHQIELMRTHHLNWDRSLVLDENDNPIPLHICVCFAHSSSECCCGAWDREKDV